MHTIEFNWSDELHKTVVKSLTTSFGLDFLLLEDKKGGNVDTIHNVRNIDSKTGVGIYATDLEEQKYINKVKYNSTEYHNHQGYIKTNRNGKEAQEKGSLTDAYTGKIFTMNASINLDHIESAKEIHEDPGRYLARINGPDLANMEVNLKHTSETLNKSKKAEKMTDYLNKLNDQCFKNKQKLAELKNKIDLSDKEIQLINKLETKINANHDLMRKYDKEARAKIEYKINSTYYAGTKFAKNLALTSGKMGLQMGTREAIGLILAETWFELKNEIPLIYKKNKINFDAGDFLNDFIDVFKNVLTRVHSRFSDLLVTFKDGFLGGILSNITTTIINIFYTTQKMIGKLIREIWNNLVQSVKLLFFNKNKLPLGDLIKEVTKLLAAGIAVCVGVAVNEELSKIFLFPFGSEIAAFISALVTGVLTLTMHYFLQHSTLMQQVWEFLNKFKSKYVELIENYNEINIELDRYLLDLAKIEFNLCSDELQNFTNDLHLINCKNERQRSSIIQIEIEKRNIQLPYEIGNTDSVVKWVKNL